MSQISTPDGHREQGLALANVADIQHTALDLTSVRKVDCARRPVSALAAACSRSTAEVVAHFGPGIVKVAPDGKLRLGKYSIAAILKASEIRRDTGETITYFPGMDLFVVLHPKK